jgi:hypothetical protein
VVPVRVTDNLTLNARVGYDITPHLTVAVDGAQLNTSQLYTAAEPTERRVLFSLTAHL